MTEPRKLRVFLCHASQDKLVVRELYQRLLSEGWIDPWLDEEKLLPGQDWDIEIEKAVENSDAITVFLSGTSVSKEGYIQKEIKVALNIALFKPEDTIFIIPVRLDDCAIPRSLKSIQYNDYFPDTQKNRSYDRLRQALRMRYDEVIKREIFENKNKEDEKQALIKAEEEKKQDGELASRKSNILALKNLDNKFHSYTGNKNEINTKVFRTYGLIEIYGRVDNSNTTQFAKAFESLLDSGTFKILIDMTNLVYISSGGFRILLSAQRTCKRYGRGEIILAGVPNRIKEALELANFTDLFRVFDDIREASGSF